MPSKADNFSEAAGQTSKAADANFSVDQGIHAAGKKNPQGDTSATIAATKPWVDGFDGKLGSKRTT